MSLYELDELDQPISDKATGEDSPRPVRGLPQLPAESQQQQSLHPVSTDVSHEEHSHIELLDRNFSHASVSTLHDESLATAAPTASQQQQGSRRPSYSAGPTQNSNTSSSPRTPRHSPRNWLIKIAQSEETTKFLASRKSIFIFEIPLVLLVIIVPLIGVGAAVAALLSLFASDKVEMTTALEAQAQQHAQLLSDTISRMQQRSSVLTEFFVIMDANVSLSDFNNFCNRTKIGPVEQRPFISDLAYMPFVQAEDRDSFITQVRNDFGNQNPLYQSYELTYQLANLTLVASVHGGMYCPVLYQYPEPTELQSSLGDDATADPARNRTVMEIVTKKQDFLTEKQFCFRNGIRAAGAKLVSPVFSKSSGNLLGLTRVHFHFDELLAFLSAAQNVDLDDEYLTLLDTTNPSAPVYLHTHLPHSQFTSPGYTNLQDDLEGQKRLLDYIYAFDPQLAVFSSSQLVNRVYTIVVLPSPQFYSRFEGAVARRWVVFAIILFVTLSLEVLLTIGIGITRLARVTISSLNYKLVEVKRVKDRMHELIEQLSQEEQRTRLTMSLIPLAVVLIDPEGRVIWSNEVFNRVFHYQEAELKAGEVYARKVFPGINFAELRMTRPKNLVEPSAQISNAFGVIENCPVSISFFRRADDGVLLPPKRTKKHQQVISKDAQLNAEFMLIIDHRENGSEADEGSSNSASGSESGSSSLTTERAPLAKLFGRMFNGQDPQLREEFEEYAKKEDCYEMIMFVNDVQEYKKVGDTFLRTEKQHQIFERYLNGKNSTHELNIPMKQLGHEIEKIRRFLGQTEVFDGVLGHVFTDLRTDLFERFMNQRRAAKIKARAAEKVKQVGQNVVVEMPSIGAASQVPIAAVVGGDKTPSSASPLLVLPPGQPGSHSRY